MYGVIIQWNVLLMLFSGQLCGLIIIRCLVIFLVKCLMCLFSVWYFFLFFIRNSGIFFFSSFRVLWKNLVEFIDFVCFYCIFLRIYIENRQILFYIFVLLIYIIQLQLWYCVVMLFVWGLNWCFVCRRFFGSNLSWLVNCV